jgi:Protein of unknown function (DUF4231)
MKRLPKPFWWRPDPAVAWPKEDWPVLPVDSDQRFPRLVQDFQLWRTEFEAPFRRLDHEAILLQNQFWRQQLALIIGGFVATVLGACQAALGGGQPGLAVAQAALTGMLTGLTALVRGRRAQRGYLTARLKAERIKSEFFLFLGGAGEYVGTGREDRLRQQVEDILDAEDAE